MNKSFDVNSVRELLFSLADDEYKRFSSSLLPTLSPERVIGVRTPVLRKISKKMLGSGEYEAFISDLPHKYYEENNLHAFIIASLDMERCIKETERFLPFVDNWGTCDSLRPACFRKHKDELLSHIYLWLESEHTYTKRFAVEMLMVHYFDEDFNTRFLDTVAGIRTEDYYLNMMVSWYFATALTKRYSEALPYIENRRLSPWVHNKAISKARDSRCISKDKKEYLKTLRLK